MSASSSLSVSEAAAALGVHPQRIHQRIQDGSLPAEKVGGRWIVGARDVNRLKGHSSPGRPLSARSAWNILAVRSESEPGSVEGRPAPVSASARSVAKSRVQEIRNLAARTDPSEDPGPVVAVLSRSLRNRAQRMLFNAHVDDLDRLRHDRRVELSGVSIPASNMSAHDMVEAYVHRDDLEHLVDEHLLVPGPDHVNVVLHVVSAVPKSAIGNLHRSSSRLLLAADLAEHDGARERGEAVRVLTEWADQGSVK